MQFLIPNFIHESRRRAHKMNGNDRKTITNSTSIDKRFIVCKLQIVNGMPIARSVRPRCGCHNSMRRTQMPALTRQELHREQQILFKIQYASPNGFTIV